MIFKNFDQKQKGFTLIELLIVIVIIAALAVTIFVALNPIQRLKDSRDARRTSDVETILTAIHEYIVDNKGVLPTGLTTSMAETQLGTSASACTLSQGGCTVAATACVDLTTPLAKYLKSIPVDPGATYSAAKTGYSVTVDANNIVTVKSCGTEGSTNVSQSR
jgi:prepilin-type N-terminal cleavage/methylation domain-containing protein